MFTIAWPCLHIRLNALKIRDFPRSIMFRVKLFKRICTCIYHLSLWILRSTNIMNIRIYWSLPLTISALYCQFYVQYRVSIDLALYFGIVLPKLLVHCIAKFYVNSQKYTLYIIRVKHYPSSQIIYTMKISPFECVLIITITNYDILSIIYAILKVR